jgi:hypothetical protein
MILKHPFRDLLFERIELLRTRRPLLGKHGLWVLHVFAHGGAANLQFACNILDGLPLLMQIVYGIHGLTPEHGCTPDFF